MKKIKTEEQRRMDKVMEDIFSKIGRRIRERREELDCTQAEVMIKMQGDSNIIYRTHDKVFPKEDCIYEEKCSRQIISRYELGITKGMSLIRFINFCIILKVTPNELLQDIVPFIKENEAEIVIPYPEITELYGQLNKENKHTAVQFLNWLCSGQANKDNEHKI